MLQNENGRERDIQCEEESKGQLRGRIFGDLYLGKYTTAPVPYFLVIQFGEYQVHSKTKNTAPTVGRCGKGWGHLTDLL